MHTTLTRQELRRQYELWAEEYLKSLPLEHFMESTNQSRQKEILQASMLLIQRQRPGFHYFEELLIQYPREGQQRPGQVCPDLMIVLTNPDEVIEAIGSYDAELEPGKLFFVMEITSPHNVRKDYVDSKFKYEHQLHVPYYAIFHPQLQQLTLFVHTGSEYVEATPNRNGRLELPEIGVELGIVDRWVRMWYQGELVPLVGELEESRASAIDLAETERKRAETERKRAETERKRAETERKRADQAEQLATESRRLVEEQQRRTEDAERRVTEQAQLVEELRRRLLATQDPGQVPKAGDGS